METANGYGVRFHHFTTHWDLVNNNDLQLERDPNVKETPKDIIKFTEGLVDGQVSLDDEHGSAGSLSLFKNVTTRLFRTQ